MEDASTLVAKLYEGHPYPPPAADLAQAIAEGGYQVGDPPLWQPMLWPEGRPRAQLKILVAGCGTTQAAWFAYTNRESAVFGVDLSEASLAHQRYLQERHQLSNLHLFKGDLRAVSELGNDFDLVVCTGVLHHLADPDEGMRVLAKTMAPHAALVCMVYAHARRVGVYMLQDAFRRLGVKADDAGVSFVRQTLETLPLSHFIHSYVASAPELQHDAAIADTFLHPQDRAYSVPQVLALVEDNGLHFQGWFENSNYYPEAATWFSQRLRELLSALPAREQWSAFEMLSASAFTHYFFARKSKPPSISFEGRRWPRLVPHHHPATRRNSQTQFRRMGFVFDLTPSELMQFELVNDMRTLGEIAAQTPDGDTPALFERLWKQGHIMLSAPRH